MWSQSNELTSRLCAGQPAPRAILLLTFQYDAPAFVVPPAGASIVGALGQGLELWQVNMRIDSWGVQYLRHFQIPAGR